MKDANGKEVRRGAILRNPEYQSQGAKMICLGFDSDLNVVMVQERPDEVPTRLSEEALRKSAWRVVGYKSPDDIPSVAGEWN